VICSALGVTVGKKKTELQEFVEDIDDDERAEDGRSAFTRR